MKKISTISKYVINYLASADKNSRVSYINLLELCVDISVPLDCLRFPQQGLDILLSQKPLYLQVFI